MAAIRPASQASQLQSYLEDLSNRLADLPVEQRAPLEEVLQKIKGSAHDLVQTTTRDERLIYQSNLLANISDIVYATDDQLRLTAWNHAAEEMYGFKEEDILGKSVLEVVQSKLSAEERVKLTRELVEKGSVAAEIEHQTRSGASVFFETKTMVLRDPAGKESGYISVNHDITERKRAEAALRQNEAHLRENEARLRRIAQAGRIGFFEWNASQDSAYWSPEHYELFGFEPGSPISWQRWEESLHPDDRERVLANAARLIERGRAEGQVRGHKDEYRYIRADGSMLWLEANTSVEMVGSEPIIRGLVRDITARKQSEEMLRYHASLVDHISEAAISTDTGFQILSWNQAAEKMYGWQANEVFGKPVALFLQTEYLDHTTAEEAAQQLFEQGQWKGEVIQRRKDGTPLYVSASLVLLSDGEGNNTGVIAINHDITARKRAEDRLKLAHEQAIFERNRLQAVMEALPIGLAILDEKGGNIQSNRTFEEVWGGARPVPRSVNDYGKYQAWWADTGKPVQPDEWASAQALQKGEPVVAQMLEIQRFNGVRAIVLNSAAPIRDTYGQILGSAVAVMDITEQKRLENVQRDHHIQMEIQTKLLAYRDQERQALARDLHDGPVQDLSGLLFNIQFAKEAITDLSMKLELDKIAAGIKNTVQNLREMMNEMRPPSLIRFGLAKAIHIFLEEFQEKHPEFVLDTSLMEDGSCLSEQVRLSLFRILQEALTNVIKHSHTNRIDVALHCSEDQVSLVIRDQGPGFSISANLLDYSAHGHYGLVGMKERAEAIGGSFQIDSQPEKGTTIHVIVPLDKQGMERQP